jgi:hypothetical protein
MAEPSPLRCSQAQHGPTRVQVQQGLSPWSTTTIFTLVRSVISRDSWEVEALEQLMNAPGRGLKGTERKLEVLEALSLTAVLSCGSSFYWAFFVSVCPQDGLEAVSGVATLQSVLSSLIPSNSTWLTEDTQYLCGTETLSTICHNFLPATPVPSPQEVYEPLPLGSWRSSIPAPSSHPWVSTMSWAAILHTLLCCLSPPR